MDGSLREGRRNRSWPEALKWKFVAVSLEPGSHKRLARGGAMPEDADRWERIDAAVLRTARLLGRQLAREEHERLQRQAANENRPTEEQESE